MSELHTLDHLFLFITGLLIPAVSAFRIRETLVYMRRGGESARVSCYRQIIVIWFVMAAVLCGYWAFLGRAFFALGVRAPAEGTELLGTLAALFFLGFVGMGLRGMARAERPAAALRKQLGEMTDILPTSEREEHWFYGVSANAGVVEELIFRGFVLWYLGHFMGDLWAAVLATLLFTFAHAYQGLRLLPGIALTSAVMVALYLYTESLLVPILLHIAVDAIQGRYFARFQRQEKSASVPDAVS